MLAGMGEGEEIWMSLAQRMQTRKVSFDRHAVPVRVTRWPLSEWLGSVARARRYTWRMRRAEWLRSLRLQNHHFSGP